MAKLIPLIFWLVIVSFSIANSRKKQQGKARGQAAENGQPQPKPPAVPNPPAVRPVRPRRMAEMDAEERRRLLEEKRQAMARRREAAVLRGRVDEEPRMAPVPSAAAVEEEGCHVTPMGAPHVSELRDAKSPAIAHMESHIGEAHGAEVHPDATTAMRQLRRAPTFAFAKTPAAFRRAVVLAEILDRPRAYRL